MRFITNGDPQMRVARHPWDQAVITPHALTIPSQGWDSSVEVKMTIREDHFWFEEDCTERVAYNVMWTQAASGGCWPFAVMVRNSADDSATKPITAMALAHLATKRDEESCEMGGLFRSELIKADPKDVFLIAMIPAALASEEEIRMVTENAFATFEKGFAAKIPDPRRIFLKTNTVNSAITRLGYYGELSNKDVEDLAKSQAPKDRSCAVFP